MAQLPEHAHAATGKEPLELLRLECRERGVDLGSVTDLALGYVLEAVHGDVDLAACAVAMVPRPGWVAEFLGP